MQNGYATNGQHDNVDPTEREPLAIVGIGCRFPGGGNGPNRFWNLLANAVDAITEVPPDRWDADLRFHPDPSRQGKTYSRWGGFLDGIDQFDAGFFGISPREATQMDPQQRMLLEVGYEAIEDAGERLEALSSTSVGVFVGISTHDYSDMLSQDEYLADYYTNSGGALSIAANRLSYAFDLRGPSMAVDTACSSALVAAHLAAQSLWRQECEAALVGGVNCMITPEPTIGFSRANMLSPDGRCKTFDARANGYVRAEGAGVVMLKPLSRALADGNSIYAVIRDTGINQDGRTRGLTLPNEEAQEALLRQIYTRLHIHPNQVAYVEAHGTGTPAGDPIEATAIGRALGQHRSSTSYLPVGSVKTNIGHLEAASGIAGLIKAALVLKHNKLVPNLHFSEPSPDIPFDDLRLRVPRQLEDLPEDGASIVGINSFGFGGANAHVVLDRAPVPVRTEIGPNGSHQARRGVLVPMSARRPEALADLARSYRALVSQRADDPGFLAGFAAATAHRRSHHEHRMTLAVRSPQDLAEQLDAFVADQERPTISTGQVLSNRPRLGFVFSGMGPQWWGMGRQLLEDEPVFRSAVEECDALFQRFASWSIIEELRKDEAASRMAAAEVAQPCNFALQVGLWALWDSWGIRPDAIVGHSAGEVAASYAARILSLKDAVTVIYHRSRLQQRATDMGRMLAVGQSQGALATTLEPWGDKVSVAAVNSPESLTLSGDGDALESVARELTAAQVFARFLDVRVPYHSHHMDPLRDELLEVLGEIEPKKAEVPYYSVVEGQLIEGTEVGKEYWWANVRQPVRFAETIGSMLDDGIATFVELSPHPVLGRSIRETANGRKAEVRLVSSLRRDADDATQMLSALGELYTLGCPVEWQVVTPRTGMRVELPSYPWQRERFWIEPEESIYQRLAKRIHPLLDQRVRTAVATWESDLDLTRLAYLKDHAVNGDVIFPAAAYLEMACAALEAAGASGTFDIENVAFKRPLLPKEGQPCFTQIALDVDGVFSISSRFRDGQPWTSNVRGTARANKVNRPTRRAVSPERFRNKSICTIPGPFCYDMLASLGLNYGPSFQGVSELSLGDREALARLSIPGSVLEDQLDYHLHPAVLDACFHALVGIAFAERRHGAGPFVPTEISRLRVYAPIRGEHLWSHAKLTRRSDNILEGDFVIFDDEGMILVEITGFHCQRLPNPQPADTDFVGALYSLNWVPRSLPGSRTRNADFIGAPASITAELSSPQRLDRVFNRTQHYTSVNPRIERLCSAYVLNAMQKLGWRPRGGQTFETIALAERLGIDVQYHELFARLLEFLAEDGVLRNHQGRWEVPNTPEPVHPERELEALEAEYPDYRPTLALIGRSGSKLDQVLSGRLDPLGLVFPKGSTEDLGGFYEQSPYTQVYNYLMREAVTAVLDELPAGRPLRILEIGAGTGGTAAHILPVLPADRAEYIFTDVSGFFFTAARHRFVDYPFVQYQTLDIESDPVDQGFEPHSFDLIIAADAIHATRDLSESLANIRSLLASHGMLVLMEIAEPGRMLEIIFGPLKGWWRFTDRELRPSRPWVDGETWKGLLENLGFSDPITLSDFGPWQPVHAVYLSRGPRLALEESPLSTSSEDSGGWLVLRDQSGYGDAVADLGRRTGRRCVLVTPSAGYARTGVDEYEIRPGNARDIRTLLHDLSEEQFVFHQIVHLWSLDAPNAYEATIDDLRSTDLRVSLTVMRLVQELARKGGSAPPRLYVVTQNSLMVGQETPPDVAQSSVWGLARVIMNEQSFLRCTVVDIPRDRADDTSLDLTAGTLFHEIVADAPDQEVVLRGEGRYVARMTPRRAKHTDDDASAGRPARAFRLDVEHKGLLESLVLRPIERSRLGPLDVEIEVEAAGLNFRDVMKALGLYPSEDGAPFWLGDECSGVIRRVGRDVTEFTPGDRVIAIGPGSFGSLVTAHCDYVVRMPRGLTFDQAAGIPIVWLTTHYALNHLARLSAGERILIHSAAGGVGLAAVQLAQLAGAEIYATAGSSEKRAFLRSLGVTHVYDSRSLEFADRIRAATNGEGVDVVINALAGDYIPTSLALLRPLGRFIELGKIDLYQNSKLGLWPFRSGLSFLAVDMSWLMEHRPALCKTLLQEVVSLFEDGRVTPLPIQAFPLADAERAFRLMAQARHIGKIVLNAKEAVPPPAPPKRDQALFRRNASYLITGGLGGFGLELAEWLVDQGARNLILTSRSGVNSPRAELAVARMRHHGARVEIIKSDVGQEADVARLVATIDATMPPLRGVFHLAMVLDDALLLQLNDRRYLRVVEPKAYGAWNLHQHTKTMQLDHFVLFSSFASVAGNMGQSNYAAANAFLDGLAQHRRALGLPGLAVDWGAIGEVGFVARNPEIGRQLERLGFAGLNPADALAALKEFLEDGDIQAAAVRVNYRNFSRLFDSGSVKRRFSHVLGLVSSNDLDGDRTRKTNGGPNAGDATDWKGMISRLPGDQTSSMTQSIAGEAGDSDIGSASRFKSAAATVMAIPENERQEALTEVLKQQFAAVTGIAVERLDSQQPIASYNLDSLMRLELVLRVEQQLGVRLEDDALEDGVSFARLAADVLLRLKDLANPAEVVST